ncbi:hypothetical protein FC98_GL002551 [Lentilactobacillus kisonensis DSM 19906 = JCM 15041]|uniref:Uncharacterized protein n=2 Tax=Lentilactobacillus kisonensis TaxID=481722 RepID=H1LFB0_9LACO|nr:hypothetical protein HMPREF9104_01287 [Lentilactobacillus kisonensis F0435]KRL22416.1 hypothetical protein FC98_GL002551 [Lentilactobacillus kisonensis DSM 19906 = JCM 15041]
MVSHSEDSSAKQKLAHKHLIQKSQARGFLNKETYVSAFNRFAPLTLLEND